jgi:hypothetical protein
MDRVLIMKSDRKNRVVKYKTVGGRKVYVPWVMVGDTGKRPRRLIKGFGSKARAMEYRDKVEERCRAWQILASQN